MTDLAVTDGLVFTVAIVLAAAFGTLAAFIHHYTPEVSDMADTTQTYGKPSDLLAAMDGHGIYDAAMLDRCEFDTDAVPTFTVAETQRAIDGRGLGGYVEDNGKRCIWGYATAASLAVRYAGRQSIKMGRGSSFRDNAAILREVGK